jgi:hypothetical protein
MTWRRGELVFFTEKAELEARESIRLWQEKAVVIVPSISYCVDEMCGCCRDTRLLLKASWFPLTHRSGT